MKWYLITLLQAFIQFNFAQSVSTLMGARSAGMGYTSSAITDESSLFNNPGAMGRLNASSSFFAYELVPTLTGANRTAAGLTIKSKFGVSGIGFFRFGDDLYSEQIVSAAFSNTLGITSLGIKVNYIQYRASGFGTQATASLDFGGLAQITPQIFVGAYITNLNQSRISETELLPTRMVVGLGFKLDDHCFLATEVTKDLTYEATWRSGFEYSIHKISIRTGFNLNPRLAFLGIGAQVHRLKMDYALQYNSNLGSSHQASAAYLFEKQINHEK